MTGLKYPKNIIDWLTDIANLRLSMFSCFTNFSCGIGKLSYILRERFS